MLLNSANHTREIGNVTENIALQHLRENGLTLVTQNFSVRLGEIDIIVEDAVGNRGRLILSDTYSAAT